MRAVAGRVLLLVAVLLLAVPWPGAAAQEPEPTAGPAPTATAPDGAGEPGEPDGSTPLAGTRDGTEPSGEPGTRLTVVAQSPWVQPKGDRFSMQLRIENAPADATITFGLHAAMQKNGDGRNRFLETIRATDTLGPARPSYTLPLANLPVDGDGVTSAFFLVDNDVEPPLGFRLDEAGVYPLQVQLKDGAGDTLAQLVTYIIRLRLATSTTGTASFSAAVVVPIHAPPAHETDGTVDLGDDGERLSDLVRVLASHPTVPVTVRPVPETLTALVDSGTVSPQSLRAALGGQQVLASPYVALQLGDWLTPELQSQLERQNLVGHDILHDLLGVEPDSRTVVVGPGITVDALAALRRQGTDQAVVPEAQLDQLSPTDFKPTLTRAFEIEGPPTERTRAVMADGTLTSHLRDTTDPVLNAHHTLADLAMLYFDQPAYRRGALMTVPDDVPPAYLDTLLAGLGTAVPTTGTGLPMLAPASVDQLFGQIEQAGERGGQAFGADGVRNEPTLVRRWTPDPTAGLGDYARKLAQAKDSLASYRSLLPEGAEGDVRTAPLDMLLLLSGSSDLDAAARQDHLDAAVATVEDVAHQIVVPAQPEITLTAANGSLPLVLENTGPAPMRVRIDLSSDKLDFPGGAVKDLTLQPGSNRIEIAVVALASGDFKVNTSITSPDGVLPLASTKLTVRSRVMTGVGLGLSIGAGVFLAIWWIRNIHRERKAKRASRSLGSPPDDGPDATTGPPRVPAPVAT